MVPVTPWAASLGSACESNFLKVRLVSETLLLQLPDAFEAASPPRFSPEEDLPGFRSNSDSSISCFFLWSFFSSA